MLTMQRVRKLVPIIVIYNMKCTEHYFISGFPKLGFVKELQVGWEFNEKLTIK